MAYRHALRDQNFIFKDMRTLLAKASPARSADELSGVAAASEIERVAARYALADVPLAKFLEDLVIPYESDAVSRLIIDSHRPDPAIACLTVGEWREWLMAADGEAIAKIKWAITPEMAAAVSKIMRVQDLIAVARKIEVVTKFRSTVGLKGRLATRLQPNHPTDDAKGISASILDGLLLGSGDALIGINPASDSVPRMCELLKLIDDIRQKLAIPTQSCVLAHVTTALRAMEVGAPVDLVFQSVAGSEKANASFGFTLEDLSEARAAGLALGRGGKQIMYFETGQGSALSAGADHGVDAQTIEARAYAVAREFDPFLVNTVVGFIGPEYLYNGKQILRAGLEDHFCGKLLGLPMGCDVCHTNHADADQDDMDTLLTCLATAGCNYIMGVPGADDIMLSYQSTSFHDALYLRETLGLRPAPEFEDWLNKMEIWDRNLPRAQAQKLLESWNG